MKPKLYKPTVYRTGVPIVRLYELATKVCMIKAKEKRLRKKNQFQGRDICITYYVTLKAKKAFFSTRIPSEFLNSDWEDEKSDHCRHSKLV